MLSDCIFLYTQDEIKVLFCGVLLLEVSQASSVCPGESDG
jgi:hypothetical protein